MQGWVIGSGHNRRAQPVLVIGRAAIVLVRRHSDTQLKKIRGAASKISMARTCLRPRRGSDEADTDERNEKIATDGDPPATMPTASWVIVSFARRTCLSIGSLAYPSRAAMLLHLPSGVQRSADVNSRSCIIPISWLRMTHNSRIRTSPQYWWRYCRGPRTP